jgi:pilus assembly protein TadC
MSSIERELLPATRALSVLLTSGAGLETAMKRIAENDYGAISKRFGTMLDESTAVGGLEHLLKREQVNVKSRGYQKLITLLLAGVRGDTDIIASLDRLAEREMQIREVETERFIDLIGMRMETFLVLGMLSPIIIIVTLMTNELMINGGLPVTPPLVGMVFWIVLFLLAWLNIQLKLREPAF